MNKIISILGISLLLWLGRPVLLPIIIAIFFWYLTNAIGEYYKRIVKSAIISKLLAGASIIGVVYFFMAQIQPLLAGLYHKSPEIVDGINRLIAGLSNFLGTDISLAGTQFPTIQEIITSVGTSIAGGGVAILTIIVYIIFLFVEQHTFTKKIRSLFPSARQFNKAVFLLHSIDSHMKKYLFVKTGISFLTAVFSYIGMLVLGIEFAIVWAFFIFILNYIPTIGSFIAGALPTMYVFATTGDIQTALLVALWIAFVNIIFGNILDPKLTGKSLNLSALVILINMMFWGMIWGPAGMFFSVPILVMVVVASAQFDKYRWIAIILSADGRIPEVNE